MKPRYARKLKRANRQKYSPKRYAQIDAIARKSQHEGKVSETS